MRLRLCSGLGWSLAFVALAVACAEQQDTPPARQTATDSHSDAGKAGTPGEQPQTAGGGAGGSATTPVATTAGTSADGGKNGTAGMSGMFGSAGAAGESEAGAGGEPPSMVGECQAAKDCDDHDPCSDDACLLQHCSHTTNKATCADDNDPCTSDVCDAGSCTHPDNKQCECKQAAQCDDKDVCTDDACSSNKCEHKNNTAPCEDDKLACTKDVCAAGKCTHQDLTCGKGTPFVVDSFNSNADWDAGKTTPDGRGIVVTDVHLANPEGNTDLYVAEQLQGSIEFALAPMQGLSKLVIKIKSEQTNSGNLIFVGLWNGKAWSEQPLGKYGTIPTVDYAALEVKTADFNQTLSEVKKLRLRFDVPTGQGVWRIDDISAAE